MQEIERRSKNQKERVVVKKKEKQEVVN